MGKSANPFTAFQSSISSIEYLQSGALGFMQSIIYLNLRVSVSSPRVARFILCICILMWLLPFVFFTNTGAFELIYSCEYIYSVCCSRQTPSDFSHHLLLFVTIMCNQFCFIAMWFNQLLFVTCVSALLPIKSNNLHFQCWVLWVHRI